MNNFPKRSTFLPYYFAYSVILCTKNTFSLHNVHVLAKLCVTSRPQTLLHHNPFIMQQKVILLTGASSGIGRETAIRLARQGHHVYGAARRLQLLQPLQALGVHPLQLDVTDPSSCAAAVQAVVSAEGRIDVLVNNAGYGHFGAVEDVPLSEARRQLEVNLFGLACLTRLVLPHMRRQHSGRIINTSSIGGHFTSYLGAWYHVSKYAVEAFSDALRMELRPHGIHVVLIEPSSIRTPWGEIAAQHLEEVAQPAPPASPSSSSPSSPVPSASPSSTASRPVSSGAISSRPSVPSPSSPSLDGHTGAYLDESRRTAAFIRRLWSSSLISGPRAVTAAISSAVNARRPSVRYVPGRFGRTLILLHTLLPTRLFDYLMRRTMTS